MLKQFNPINIEAPSRNRLYRRKAMCITFSVCVSATLFILHAKRMRLILFPSVACLAVTCFSTLSHKQFDFRGGGKRY